MKGLDTNLLVRYLVKDDRRQAERASRFMSEMAESGTNCFINQIVLCELVWVLESAYGYPKKEIADVLDKIMAIRQFVIESKDLVRQAISDYREGKADLADYLVGRTNHAQGCDRTFTFDRALKGQPLLLCP